LFFNGEIYNYREIRHELSSNGYSFNTDSDTEVLLAGLTVHGRDFLPKLNGMFAFCFYHAKKNRIMLSRDSLGKKPLYFSIDNGTLNFCSSQIALRSIQRDLTQDEKGIEDFLLLGYYIDSLTPYASIQSVNPGEILEACVKTPTELTRTKIGPFHPEEKPKNLRECLTSAIQQRIHGHDHVAISLSGGLDSTLVALILSEIKPNCTAFSACWPDSDKSRYNEDSEVAFETAKQLGIEFNKVNIFEGRDLERMLNLYLEVMEEPNNNSTGLSMLNLYESMSQSGFRLALTGDGADEIFGGYSRYVLSEKIPNLLNSKSPRYRRLVLDQKNQRFGNLLGSQLDSQEISKYLKWHLIFTPEEISQLIPKLSAKNVSNRFLRELSNKIQLDSDSTRENFMQFDSQLWLSMESNRRLDRVSMSHSLEARSPFEDEVVRSYARELIRNEQSKVTKREIFLEAFPELINIRLQQEKVGFISPIGHWLRNNRKLVSESLNFLASNLGFNRALLNELNGAPDRGNFAELTKLWTLLVLAQWNMNHAK
jgi:asparagine synthase (glutamine-hydrolysing)